MKEQAVVPGIFREFPDVKLKQFAAEARSLDVASMNDLTETKRLTFAATLVFSQTGRALDDVADMYVRLVQFMDEMRSQGRLLGKPEDMRLW